jgi:hypothetical protein
MSEQKFIEISKSFFIDKEYRSALEHLGLTDHDAVFSFSGGKNLRKPNLADYRSRLRFQINVNANKSVNAYLKRYINPPLKVQLTNWLTASCRVALSFSDHDPARQLAQAGIGTYKTIAYGWQWSKFFEKRSFIITEEIPNAEALERKLPACFDGPTSTGNLKLRRDFIGSLADFIKKFHTTGYRHRDLYLSHIFYSDNGKFYLIDLARAFKPLLLDQRFRTKDIAQLYYSAPGRHFSRTDRLRFYLRYTGKDKLTSCDKSFIRKVLAKVERIARHDKKHNRQAPFCS